jgi:hypothetical protein
VKIYIAILRETLLRSWVVTCKIILLAHNFNFKKLKLKVIMNYFYWKITMCVSCCYCLFRSRDRIVSPNQFVYWTISIAKNILLLRDCFVVKTIKSCIYRTSWPRNSWSSWTRRLISDCRLYSGTIEYRPLWWWTPSVHENGEVRNHRSLLTMNTFRPSIPPTTYLWNEGWLCPL